MRTTGKRGLIIVLFLLMIFDVICISSSWTASAVNASDLTLRYPVSGYTYMYVSGTNFQPNGTHKGSDFGGDTNNDALAAADGVVKQTYIYTGNLSYSPQDQRDGGTRIAIYHAALGIYTVYKHLDAIYVSEGQTVKAGDPIGSLGNTGYSQGVHLHFDICTSIHNYAYPDKDTTINPEQCNYYFFTTPTTPPQQAIISINKSSAAINEMVTFNLSTDGNINDLWVYYPDGSSQAYSNVGTSYSLSFSAEGRYQALVQTWNNYGNKISERISFSIGRPTQCRIGIGKSNYKVNEKVSFSFETDGNINDLWVYYPDGSSQAYSNVGTSYSLSFSAEGRYQALVQTWNNYGNKISEKISFSIGRPTQCRIGIEKSNYKVNETVSFSFETDGNINDLWVYHPDGGSQAYCNVGSFYSLSFSTAGNYQALVQTWNESGAQSSEKINFVVYEMPEKPVIQNITNNGDGTVTLNWNKCRYTDGYSIRFFREGESSEYVFLFWITDQTEYTYELPDGNYTAFVTAQNQYNWTNGNHSEMFTVQRNNALSPNPKGGAVVNAKSRQITGISAGVTAAEFEQNYVSVSGGSLAYEHPTEKQVMGTGTKVKIYDIEQELVDTYTIVLFGDVNGDGWYDGTDAYLVNLAANGMVSADDLTEAQRTAADCNHDGSIDTADVALLEQAGLLLANVDQTLPQEDLEINSVYLEYCSLIDQSIEITEPEQPAVDQPAQTAEQPAAPSVWDWIKTLFTVVLNWLLRVF